MSVLLHLQWRSVVWKMRKEFGLLPGGVERFEQALPASPQVDLVTNAMRRQNHSVCRFRLPQIETSTRSALIKRQPMTSSSPGGARVAPLIQAWHRFLCSHFSAGGIGESVLLPLWQKGPVLRRCVTPRSRGVFWRKWRRWERSIDVAGNVLNQRRAIALVSSSTRRACKSQTAAGRRLWSRKGTVKRDGPCGKPRMDLLASSYLHLQRIFDLIFFFFRSRVDREDAGIKIRCPAMFWPVIEKSSVQTKFPQKMFTSREGTTQNNCNRCSTSARPYVVL